jgi:PAS domain-containing protein
MRRNRSIGEYQIIIFSVILGIFAYVIAAAVDTFIFHDGPFLDVLIFAVPFGDMCVRLYVFASFVAFGIFISRMLAKRKKTEETLRESEEKFRTLMEEAPVGIL